MKLEELQQKKVAIVGLGVEGLATAEYFSAHNITFETFDEKDGQITGERLSGFDIVVRSPGVSLHKAYFKDFKGEITSQTKLFFDNSPAKIIGVTGTKGKGTTSSLLYELLKSSGRDVYLGGNIGKPPFTFLDSLEKDSLVVLELSSFQLEDLKKSPQVAIMLMMTTDHLEPYGNRNYHTSLDEYYEAKRNILRWQTADDMAILNKDYVPTKASADATPARLSWVSRYSEVENGCFVRNGKVILRSGGQETEVTDVEHILLPGAHNLENVCAAVMVAHAMGVSTSLMSSVLRTFRGLEHRLELVREVGEVKYYDDSIATSSESALAGIQAFTAPKILILGGTSEGSDFTELGEYISKDTSIKAIVGIGKEWPTIKSTIKTGESRIQVVEGLTTMKDIVRACQKLSRPGDIVLLSPACKSYDMFESYKDRGSQFKEQVNLL